MRWSFKLGKIFGIDFRIHVTFFLLLFFVFISGLSQRGPEQAIRAVLFISAVFACVIIHELSHSLIARRFGKEAKSITLLPIGGVATMEEMPEKPGQEIAMSIVGPFINLLIAGLLYVLIGHWTGISVPNLYPESTREFFAGLIGVNIILAIFNLIPAFPMDGGRVLRGILGMRVDHVRATSMAVAIGQAFSLLFIFYGLFFNWWLILIGLFLYIGAGSEKQQVMLLAILRGVPASEIMATDFRSLRPNEPLSRSLEHIYHGCQEDFPVVGDRGIEGVLTRMGILSAIHEKGVEVPVSEVMDRNFPSIDLRTSLDQIYRKLQSAQKTCAAVLEGDQLKGMLCLDGISRYLMIQSAMRGIEAENIPVKS
ncbi:MAG: site-2 protease family protein [Deltaproteobacteria bacterium]|nr:MAG: site-2 protease family protein [Deltaproteobacteria bacterium]